MPRGHHDQCYLICLIITFIIYMVYGWGSKRFPRYYVLLMMNRWGFHRHAHGDFPVSITECVLIEYIWFMGGDLNSF